MKVGRIAPFSIWGKEFTPPQSRVDRCADKNSLKKEMPVSNEDLGIAGTSKDMPQDFLASALVRVVKEFSVVYYADRIIFFKDRLLPI